MIKYIDNGGEIMLLFSYIISAALEAAITWLEYQATGEIPVIYALLAGSS